MFKKILIANRGEIAVRIMRSAQRLGVKTVAVVSAADRGALFARLADHRVEIGPGPAQDSYLRGDKIIAAAKGSGADAIHPGYGFLAENAHFAEAVGQAGITFIGPSPQAMRRLGGKAEAKAIAAKAGVPVVPGFVGESQALKTLAVEAKRIGYPVMIKAVAGGGGRGMRLVAHEGEFAAMLESAQREAEAAFGDGRILIEKVIANPRHIEVQVFGDSHGNVVHLFERDCSLQRRHQKVIEESPAPGMSPELRTQMTKAAVACARAVGYEGAGTVEFLVEGGVLVAQAPWFFIEMNTRLQVEHPVTEEICGLDLVEWQLRVAAGEPLPLQQGQIKMSGHAIEARLNAEDPEKGFLPSTGSIVAFQPPAMAGLRIETGVEQGSVISPFYDSMIAKLITSGPDRTTAIARLAKALEATVVAGPKTNAAFLHALVTHPTFAQAKMDTGFIGRELERLAPAGADARAIAFGVERLLAGRATLPPASPWSVQDAFQIGAPRRQIVTVLVDGTPTKVHVSWGQNDGQGGPRVMGANPSCAEGPLDLRVVGDGNPLYVLCAMRQIEIRLPTFDASEMADAGDDSVIRAPIIGRVAKLFVKQGDTVAKGDRIAVVEAMKMEHLLHAPRDGAIAKITVNDGDQVTQGAVIATLAER
jgi:3-methylcrotonyl-CoA carboxylase alpha subunit